MVSKLTIRILVTIILDFNKLVSISLLETNLKSKILVAKNLINNVGYKFKNYFKSLLIIETTLNTNNFFSL